MAERKDIMLAYQMTQARLEKMPRPIIVQPKLNGNRCRALFNNDRKVSLLSSSALPIVSVQHINKQLETLPIQNVELDGELYRHGWSHQKINGIVRRTIRSEPLHEQINYYIFDLVNTKIEMANRLMVLKQINGFIAAQGLTHIVILKSYFADTVTNVMFWLSKFMEEGYEGIILRSPAALYVRKRTTNLLKLKPMKFDTFEIVGYKKELTKVCIACKATPSRCRCLVAPDPTDLVEIPLDTLGAFHCKTFEGKLFWVGSGHALTDATRRNFWLTRQTYIGKKALVKFQNLSDEGKPIGGVLEEVK